MSKINYMNSLYGRQTRSYLMAGCGIGGEQKSIWFRGVTQGGNAGHACLVCLLTHILLIFRNNLIWNVFRQS